MREGDGATDGSGAAGVTPARSTVAEHQRTLIGGDPALTMVELAERAAVPVEAARTFWRAMGFPDVADDVPTFTDRDVAALRAIAVLVEDGTIDLTTAVSLVRAQSHTADRLALWQTEALVEDAARRLHLDDTSARLVVLDRMAAVGAVLEDQIVYAWRRQLASLAARIESEVSHRPDDGVDADALPLPRALGFADMVSFTTRSASLGSQALARLVQGFEFAVRDVITSHGARVVKTIGDAVLFVADDLPTAAEVAVDLIAAIDARPDLLPVRASLVWGRVVSRSGDVFGPTVNLASRLVDVAAPGTVLMDAASADALVTGPKGSRFVCTPRPEADMPGIGTVRLAELRRAEPGRRS
ncbi:adenylate/guanylate cyclase domain-containing protein [Georgenia faecalis]|uniref:Adenylate/guanylate cyclase domain-containing protein n=1 Tax=Georgenia faecalis TaxID=2483799 RepID=A0ABV9D685_9MICO|nr:adenylate/guanylate cyclase domain-containing protein [Georgenia faecalis]